MKDHVRATIADLRVQVDTLVEIIDFLERLPDDAQDATPAPAAPTASVYAPDVPADEVDMLTEQQLKGNGHTKPPRKPSIRDISQDIPRVCRLTGTKSKLALEVCRQLPEPFQTRDLARQTEMPRASASQLTTNWHKVGWLASPSFGKWTRTTKFPAPEPAPL